MPAGRLTRTEPSKPTVLSATGLRQSCDDSHLGERYDTISVVLSLETNVVKDDRGEIVKPDKAKQLTVQSDSEVSTFLIRQVMPSPWSDWQYLRCTLRPS
jgi:hypothetical protein